MQETIEILTYFHEKASRLFDKKYEPLHRQSFSLNLEDGKGSIKTKMPNQDLLKVFLMDSRMFILQKENKYSFRKVCDRLIDEGYEKDKVTEWRDAWDKVMEQEIFALRVGDKKLTNKKIFNTILNEAHFHQEKAQKGMADITLSQFIEPAAYMKFYDTLNKIHRIICAFDKQIVEKYLEQYENRI